MERAVEPVTAPVSGKDSPCAVASVRGGCEPDHKESGGGVAEAGHRPSPVVPIGESSDSFACDLFSPGYEARAEAALDDLFFELR